MASPELTIVTVVMEKHYEYIPQQMALIETLNPGVAWKLIVVDNTQSSAGRSVKLDPRVQFLQGPAADSALPENYRASYHHAAGLQVGLAQAAGRFVLVLDPDLFVVYRNWIREALAHMQRRGLAVLGAPWHPRWHKKDRDFPSPHFLLIDTDRIPKASLDFTPDLLRRRPGFEFSNRLGRWSFLGVRWWVGGSRDTAWRIGDAFPSASREMLSPVIDLARDFVKPAFLRTPFGRWRERLLPPKWRLIPAPGRSVPASQAPGFRLSTFETLAPETFVWRGAPFAFHLRRYVRDVIQNTSSPEVERSSLEAVLEQVRTKPLWPFWAGGETAA